MIKYILRGIDYKIKELEEVKLKEKLSFIIENAILKVGERYLIWIQNHSKIEIEVIGIDFGEHEIIYTVREIQRTKRGVEKKNCLIKEYPHSLVNSSKIECILCTPHVSPFNALLNTDLFSPIKYIYQE